MNVVQNNLVLKWAMRKIIRRSIDNQVILAEKIAQPTNRRDRIAALRGLEVKLGTDLILEPRGYSVNSTGSSMATTDGILPLPTGR